ncbi:MAG TPA: TauD/TfdA family dioxygenase [Roseomonas sp.]|jgi:taurine dioxygenase
MDLTIRPIMPGFAAEVAGVDLAQPVGDNLFQQIRQAWLDADGLLLLRNQAITPEQHIAFSRQFGDLHMSGGNPVLAQYYLPGHPEIYRVSNKKIDGKPQGREDAGTYWHSDGSWQPSPPMASLLHALEIPPIGGDTIFANMYRAYETLSAPMKRMLDGLEVVHSLAAAVMKTSYGKEYVGKLDEAAAKHATHPLVRTHPESKRKALFVNKGFTSHIVGLPQAESDAILNFLFEHSTAPENLYRHRWQKHDVVIWDNRCAMHYAVADYKAHGDRYMHRTTVKGDTPH